MEIRPESLGMSVFGGRGVAASRSVIVLAAVAVLLSAPMLTLGILYSHSSPYSLLWGTQFAEQFRAGILYPRWLAESFNGLGSPTFYFYAPLPFWFDALISVISFNMLPDHFRLSVTLLLMLYSSGLAMYAWLRHETRSRTASLVGAVAYMAAPYHMLDLYVRGALAEYAAFAILPLVMLAIRLAADGRRGGLALLSLAYAALLMTHLPTSLLATITVIPAYVLLRAWRLDERRSAISLIARAVLAGTLGVGLAAIYLVPALSLQEWISSEILWGLPQYQPENWLPLRPGLWMEPSPHLVMHFVISAIISALFVALGLCALWPMMAADRSRRVDMAFWIALTLTAVALVTGLVPGFWSLPLLGKVQFPWRLLLVVEFAAVTALCLAFTQARKAYRGSDYVYGTVAAALLVAAVVASIPGVWLLASDAIPRIEFTSANAPLRQFEALEYLPRGYAQANNRGFPELGADPLPAAPRIACEPVATICRADEKAFGALTVVVESPTPTTVTLRRFVFPGWRIGAGFPVVATDWRLVSFVAPAGRTTTSLERVMLPAEKWGLAISGLSLILWVVVLASSWSGADGLSMRLLAFIGRRRGVEAGNSSSSH